MVVRAEAIQVRLQRLEEVISELERLGDLDLETLRVNVSQRWAVERGLQLGAEILFDIGNHILSAHFGVSPEDYGDIVRQLANRGVIGEELRNRLSGLSGFRNILVHDYMRLDPDKVFEALGRAPVDFSDLARAVRVWLASLDKAQ